MPESTAPVTPNYVNLNDGPFRLDNKPAPVDYDLQDVVQTFNMYETQRNTNYDWRWLECDSLYAGVVQTRRWEGSDKPKASVPNNIAFDHVESALGFIESAIFDIPEWFGIEAVQETSPKDAREVRAVYEDAFTTPYENYSTVQAEMRMGFKSGLTYGTGMLMMEWDGRRPIFSNLDIRDVYVDYGLKSPRIDDARMVIIRAMVSVDDLKAMAKGNPRISLPDDNILYYMTNNYPTVMADASKQQRELLRGAFTASTMNEQLPNPAQNPIEVLRAYTRGKIVWTLNRVHTMMRMPNPYGFMPVLSFPCRPQLGRFYGSGFPEAIKYQQRVTEALGDVHLNELHLAIDPTKTAPIGTKPSELITRPGNVSYVSNTKDVVVHQPPGATKDVMNEITYYEQMAEKRNGISSIAQGAARGSNLNRTATGVSAQAEGTNIRLKHVIENIRDYMIIPMLYKMRKMYQIHTTPDQVLMTVEQENEQPKLITAAVFHKPVKMIMDAASRMITRDRLGQNLGTLFQYMINGAVIQGLNATGKTIDFEEVAKTVQDAAGLPRLYQWVRPMSEQEQQALNAPPPEAQMQMQVKQGDQELRREVAGMKYQTEMAGVQAEITKAQIMKQPDPMEAQMKQAEMGAKLQFEQQRNQQKMESDYQKNQMKMQAEREKIQMKAEFDRQKLDADRAKLQSDVQAKQVESQGKIQQHVLSLHMQREQAEETRRQALIDRQSGVNQPKQGARK